MAGFVDVLLRGVLLVGAAVALGGVVFARAVLGAGPGTKPDASVQRALRLTALGALALAAAQLSLLGVSLATLLPSVGSGAAGSFAQTSFAVTSAIRVALGLAAAGLAWRVARRPAGRAAWGALTAAAVLAVAASAGISHAIARLDHRPLLLFLDAVHQLAAAVWVGGLVHLLVLLRDDTAGDRAPLRRFSTIALAAVTTLIVAGTGLSLVYVGDPRALLETAYGVMVLTKVTLLAAILALGAANFRLVRRAAIRANTRALGRFVEVETGLAITVLFAAASLTSLPPAVDVRAERATLGEVIARFSAMPPRLTSPTADDLNRQTNPLAGGPATRLRIEREWSEVNHHWAGLFVLAMGLAAIAHRSGVRSARHWPLLLVGLAAVLVVRTDPEVWPLGPVGFFASLAQPEILQHRAFMVLAAAFGIFEWAVRTGRLAPRPWAYAFPVLCALGGGLLLTHSHAVFDVKEAFLMEVTHAPIGVLATFAGWARWLELRLPDPGPWPGRVWSACLTAVGVVLLVYSEG
jgi:putative copper resistance protein D